MKQGRKKAFRTTSSNVWLLLIFLLLTVASQYANNGKHQFYFVNAIFFTRNRARGYRQQEPQIFSGNRQQPQQQQQQQQDSDHVLKNNNNNVLPPIEEAARSIATHRAGVPKQQLTNVSGETGTTLATISSSSSSSSTRRRYYARQSSSLLSSSSSSSVVGGMLARAKSTTQQYAYQKSSDIAYFMSLAKSQLRDRQGKRRPLNAAIEKDLMKTTKLSGGADSSASDSAADSSSAGETSPSRENDTPSGSTDGKNFSSKYARPFFGGFGSKKQAQMPKTSSSSSLISTKLVDLQEKLKSGANLVQETSSRVGPSILTALSVLYHSEKGISFLSLYAFSLLGASCGFYLFLYFITVGYALGVTLPTAAALYVYNKHRELSRLTIIHSSLTIAWGVRMVSFLLWREYVSWSALHQKVVELQSRMIIPFASKLLCWVVYSFLYVAMVSMNWSRLQQNSPEWGLLGYAGLFLQLSGLTLETIADLQKNGFKSRHRHSWCNIGLWGWSTHPNYLGEGMFWWGTYLAHGFDSIPHSLMATTGLVFIMIVLKGSSRSLSQKQLEKYGNQPKFCEFYRTHGLWGPKRWWWWLHGMEELSTSQKEDQSTATSNISSPSMQGIEEDMNGMMQDAVPSATTEELLPEAQPSV